MKDSTHKVKYSKSNDTYQVWLGDKIVTDFATKEKADAEVKRLNALQDAKNIDKAQVGEDLKESTINEVKEMTFGAYLDDLDNRFVDLMKAAKGLNAEGSQEIDMRATINQNFTLFRNYISALKKEYRDELNKELTFSINETKEGQEIWPKEITSRYSDEYRFELQKVEPAYKDKPGKAKYHVIDIESGELRGTPVFGSIKSLEAFADDLIKPQGGRQSTNLGEDINNPATVNEASKGAKNYFDDLKYNYQKAFRYLEANEKEEYKRLAKDYFSKLQVDDKVKAGVKEALQEAKKDIYDKFLDNPQKPKGRAKAIISKFKKKYGEDATEMAVDRFSKQNNLKPEEKYILKYITKNDIKITSQPGGPDLSAVNEAKATCCHRCGRVHVKGTPCKKPYLKGKDSCAIKEVQKLQERLNNLKETKSAPKGHYFTKSGNLVKGKMTKDAEERGARKSDPKDKMRTKIPKVTQYTEIVKEYIKSNPKIKKSKMMEAVRSSILQRLKTH